MEQSQQQLTVQERNLCLNTYKSSPAKQFPTNVILHAVSRLKRPVYEADPLNLTYDYAKFKRPQASTYNHDPAVNLNKTFSRYNRDLSAQRSQQDSQPWPQVRNYYQAGFESRSRAVAQKTSKSQNRHEVQAQRTIEILPNNNMIQLQILQEDTRKPTKPIFSDEESYKMIQTYSVNMIRDQRLREHLMGNPLIGYLMKNQNYSNHWQMNRTDKTQGALQRSQTCFREIDNVAIEDKHSPAIARPQLGALTDKQKHSISKESIEEDSRHKQQSFKSPLRLKDFGESKLYDMITKAKRLEYLSGQQWTAKEPKRTVIVDEDRPLYYSQKSQQKIELQGKTLSTFEKKSLISSLLSSQRLVNINALQKPASAAKENIINITRQERRPASNLTLLTLKADATKQKSVIVLKKQDIQTAIRLFNEFVKSMNNVREATTPQTLKDVKRLAKMFGISLSNNDLEGVYLRSKEFQTLCKSKLYPFLNQEIIQLQVQKQPQKKSAMYKFWIECSGNNHILVKTIIKRRQWITLASEYDPSEVQQDQEQSAQDHPYTQPNLIWTQMRRSKLMAQLTSLQIYNHLDGINCIVTKSGLFKTLKAYYELQGKNVFDYLPVTFLIELNQKDKEQGIKRFSNAFNNDIWILKPGEGTNRGHGIQIQKDLNKIIKIINQEYSNVYKTVILQKYISNPYLINKRKFDIRVFALLTWYQDSNTLRGYFYNEGYLRTSCKDFSLAKIDNKYIHLTNDAVQKNCQDYGKYENGNKLSYDECQKIFLKERNVSFYDSILPQIRDRIRDVFEAASSSLVGEIRKDYNGFELMGFDFMIDSDLKLSLIEVNTNPCLETQSCSLLQRIIPQVVDQTLKIAVDPFLRGTEHQYFMNQDIAMSELKYELVFENKM